MSRVDLDQIQAQLKVAIQSHQILVAKMKNDPQNAGLQKQLHELQSEITSLSERQKSIVQFLRKELVNKQSGPVTSQPQQVLSPAPAHQPLHLPTRVSLPPPQTAPTNLSIKGPNAATYVIHNNNNNNTVLTSPTSIISPSPKPAHTNNNNSTLTHNGQSNHAPTPPPPLSQPRPLLLPSHPHPPPLRSPAPATLVSSHVATSKAQGGVAMPAHLSGGVVKTHLTPVVSAALQVAAAARTGSPPIRVPTYNRPSILQVSGRRTPVMRTVNIAPHRKNSDSDITDVKRLAIEKKQLSPEEKKKQEYMACLDLVTHDTLKELQSKRSERKRRSTANPQFSYGYFEPERKRVVGQYLANNTVSQGPRKRGRPPKNRPPVVVSTLPQEAPVVTNGATEGEPVTDCDQHEDYCAVCQRSGELLMCDTCNLVYHLNCLDPPLINIPQGLWCCPKCVALNKNSNNWTGTLALVHSYIAQKAAKDDEKRKLQKRKEELAQEKSQLEAKTRQLTENIAQQIKRQTELMAANKTAQISVDRLKAFIKFFQSS